MVTENFKGNPDNRFDTEMRLKALKNAEKSHQKRVGEENRAGIPSFDEGVVLDWLKNRTKMPDKNEIQNIEAIKQPEGEYELELKKLRALTQEELSHLLKGVENWSKEGSVGLFSKGKLLNGYAIDTVTLRFLQSEHHEAVDYMLERQLPYDPKVPYEIEDRIRKIVKGLVYLNVPGFKTPIVELYLGSEQMGTLVPENDVRRIVNFLKDQRKLLPVGISISKGLEVF